MILQEIMKKYIYLEHQTLGWWVIHPSDSAYCVEDCLISYDSNNDDFLKINDDKTFLQGIYSTQFFVAFCSFLDNEKPQGGLQLEVGSISRVINHMTEIIMTFQKQTMKNSLRMTFGHFFCCIL